MDIIAVIKNFFAPRMIISLFAAAVIGAVISGGTVFLWQRRAAPERFKAESEKQVEESMNTAVNQLKDAQELVARLEAEKKELEKKACKGVWEDNTCKEPAMKLVAPNGGETLCLGSNFTIEWESSGLKIVRLYVVSGEGIRYTIGAFPATFSETGETGKGTVVWKVGDAVEGQVKEGYTYTVEINSSDGGSSDRDKDVSDNIFSIIRCEG